VRAYFILLTWDADPVQLIRDFRYVTYIADEAGLADACAAPGTRHTGP
jgi:hypothetical protein